MDKAILLFLAVCIPFGITVSVPRLYFGFWMLLLWGGAIWLFGTLINESDGMGVLLLPWLIIPALFVSLVRTVVIVGDLALGKGAAAKDRY